MDRLLRETEPLSGYSQIPVPQYWNSNQQQFEKVTGRNGGNFIVSKTGEIEDLQTLLTEFQNEDFQSETTLNLVNDSINALQTQIINNIQTESTLSQLNTKVQTENTLTSVLNKLSSDPQTETTLSSISSKLTDVQKNTTLTDVSTKLDSIQTEDSIRELITKLYDGNFQVQVTGESQIQSDQTLQTFSDKFDSDQIDKQYVTVNNQFQTEQTQLTISSKLSDVQSESTLSSVLTKLSSDPQTETTLQELRDLFQNGTQSIDVQSTNDLQSETTLQEVSTKIDSVQNQSYQSQILSKIPSDTQTETTLNSLRNIFLSTSGDMQNVSLRDGNLYQKDQTLQSILTDVQKDQTLENTNTILTNNNIKVVSSQETELQLESTQSSLLSSSESIDTKMDTLNTLQTESTVSQIDSKLTDGSQKQNVVVNELPSDTTNYTITSQPQSQTQTVDNTTPLLLEIQTPGQDNRRVLIVTNNSIQSYMRIGGSDIQPNKGIIIPPKDSIQLSFDKTNYVQIYQIQDSSDVSISYTEIY